MKYVVYSNSTADVALWKVCVCSYQGMKKENMRNYRKSTGVSTFKGLGNNQSWQLDINPKIF